MVGNKCLVVKGFSDQYIVQGQQQCGIGVWLNGQLFGVGYCVEVIVYWIDIDKLCVVGLYFIQLVLEYMVIGVVVVDLGIVQWQIINGDKQLIFLGQFGKMGMLLVQWVQWFENMWQNMFVCGVVIGIGVGGVFVKVFEKLVQLVLCMVKVFSVGLVVGVVVDCFIVVVCFD